uniref:Peptidase M20 dimerisation domain-containing protein n=1 Tax=Palpitomonas bilix TaxID=652834 RepID=A0A7S3G3X8_9EUKA
MGRCAKACGIASAALAILIAIGVYNTLLAEDMQVEAATPDLSIFDDFDFEKAVDRLGKAVRIRTVSYLPHEVSSPDNFFALHHLIETSFPLVHSHLKKEVIGKYSLVYYWEGSEIDLMPYMLMSHLDVVPVENDTLNKWTHEPFAGHVIDGYIYGRGTMDDKNGVFGILEAVEHMLKHGHKPRRSVYLAFGHDEEVTGLDGMSKIAQALQKRDVKLLFAMDEGGLISIDSVPGPDRPVALIGITEKGYVDVELTVEMDSGHSSMPPRPDTPLGVLSNALINIEAYEGKPNIEMVAMLWGHLQMKLPFWIRFILRNLSAFKPLLNYVLSQDPATNALIRTTFAPTMIKGSDKRNSLPISPTANINVRIAPGSSVAEVKNIITDAINDPRVKVTLHDEESTEPSPVSPVICDQFRLIQSSIMEINPDVYVAPFVMIGATDAHHLYGLTDYVYRFAPFRATKEDLKRFHGLNERISLDDFRSGIHLYYRIMKNADEYEAGPRREWASQAHAGHSAGGNTEL